MATGGYEIPNEMRDFAEKSVEQARKAFDSFMDAAHKAAATVETQTETAQKNARGAASAAVSFAEANVAASFELAEKLLKAKSLEEVVAIQTEFAKAQASTLSRQVDELTRSGSRS